MKDGMLIIIALVFIFIVWVWTGGPSRPISFSGPFITPLTTVGDVQTGYGPDISTSKSSSSNGSYWSLKSTLGSYEGSGTSVTGSSNQNQLPNPSPFRGHIMISNGATGPSYSDPDSEYVSIRNQSSGDPVDVTGWAVVSLKSGNAVYLPQAAEIAKYHGGASLKDITLDSGEEAVIYTGKSPAGGDSFRETVCTRYLDAKQQYSDCLHDNRDQHYFADNTWLVYLNRTRGLWEDSHETLRLLDAQGRTVDQYSY